MNIMYRFLLDIKAWLPPMRLTYSHVYYFENKYNPIGGNTSNTISKKLILQLFVRLFVYSHKNNIKTFWYYSHNNLIRLLRKTAETSVTFDVNSSKMNEQTKFGKLLGLIK